MTKCKQYGQLNGVHKMGVRISKNNNYARYNKCKGENCLLKEKCYRYTAKDSEYRQAYFAEIPIKNGICEMYWGEQNIVSQLEDIVSGNKK